MNTWYGKAIITLATWAISITLCAEISTATVTGGKIQGASADGVSAFLGIPFAAPPVGENRWRAPQVAPSWEDVRKADAFGPTGAWRRAEAKGR